jgi:transposase-like protein
VFDSHVASFQNQPFSAFFCQNQPYFTESSPKPITQAAYKMCSKSNEFRIQYLLPKNTIIHMQCPFCGSKEIIRKGKRKLKYDKIQIYRCNSCKKHFSEKEMRHKSYPAKIILNTISTYNLGYTLNQTKKEIAKRFHIRIPESTIHSWIKEYSDICRFLRLREQAIKLFKPEDMIFSQKLQHKQVYEFKLHKAKLELLKKELPELKFQLLKNYLEKIPTQDFPHHIFTIPDEELEKRASQLKANLLKITKLEKQNLANALASLGLQLAKTNKERHETIQNFMIINDSVTVACEVPVYLTGDDIKYFLSKGFNFNFENYRTPITGHIDILQIRNGLIHILDYKPEAEKVNAVNQLTIYALALASRTKLAVKDFKCAWFNEKNYYEFFPLHAVYKI